MFKDNGVISLFNADGSIIFGEKESVIDRLLTALNNYFNLKDLGKQKKS